jgi:hypothetical protein
MNLELANVVYEAENYMKLTSINMTRLAMEVY